MNKIIKMLASFLILMLVFNGCTDSNIVEPQQPTVSQELQGSNDLNKLNFGFIPNQISVSKKIDGSKGGFLVLSGIYKNAKGQLITVLGTLTIQKNSFKGTKVIRLQTDPRDPGVICTPATKKFDKPLQLSLTFIGLDLKDLNLTNDVKFAYIGIDGTIEPTKNDGIRVNLSGGILSVVGADLEHFSKFCFTR